MSTAVCHEVTPACPVSATVLGYYPNLGINTFFSAGFALCLVGLLVTGIWKRTWGYSAALTAGCMLELAGYVARVQLHYNPWNNSAFETQICAIILAPTLICISIYLTLKHVTLALDPRASRLRPRLYPAVFVPADVSCLLLQAVGGSMAASASYDHPTLLLAGDRVIITGIALQVVVLAAFGAMVADYYVRVRRWIHRPDDDGEGELRATALRTWADPRFRRFAGAVAGAYAGILIRCIYRIAEMAGGWGNYIMQDEPSFIVLEGFCILVPVALLTAFPPGFLFPAMAQREAQRFRRNKNKSKKSKKDEKDEKAADDDVAALEAGERRSRGEDHSSTEVPEKSSRGGGQEAGSAAASEEQQQQPASSSSGDESQLK
ncbi:RTA1-domain-containing protein [Xylariaceae sp. FL0804]|nr:RTA1-domain-containing protein [Xylariaceae sp. FL0804]